MEIFVTTRGDQRRRAKCRCGAGKWRARSSRESEADPAALLDYAGEMRAGGVRAWRVGRRLTPGRLPRQWQQSRRGGQRTFQTDSDRDRRARYFYCDIPEMETKTGVGRIISSDEWSAENRDRDEIIP